MQKLSTALYDAEISGNTEEADKLRSEINDRFHASTPKAKEAVVDFNTILNNDKASVKRIYDFMNKGFGNDWWEWETETIDHVLWIHYAVALEGVNREKLFAIRHLCNNDRPFSDWYEYNQCALAFAGAMADFECLKKPSPGMVINAIHMMNYIRPDRESKFGGDVIRYICICLVDDALYISPPSIAPLIQERMIQVVFPEMQSLWPKIIEKYNKLITSQKMEYGETTIDIQAKRLFLAEASAVTYGS